jgi:Raf kinase inhibitor-like YbhB/YbcL family protein
MSISHQCCRPSLAVTVLMLGVASLSSGQTTRAVKVAPITVPAHAAAKLKLTAPDFESKDRITQAHVYNGMGCNGQNISPALEWGNTPAGTKSFAVTMYDPDAPTGSGWWHWVMYNIPASATGLPAGAGNGRNAPRGSVQGMTDFGTKGYGGPCPPVGDKPHHYHITVFALKTDRLDVPANATSAYIGFNLNANKIETSRVTGRYGRK